MSLETTGFHVFESCPHCAYVCECVYACAHTPKPII